MIMDSNEIKIIVEQIIEEMQKRVVGLDFAIRNVL